MRQWILKNNLSSGELSPLLWTRTDVQQYANGAKKILNGIPLVEGGVKKRPGTKYRGVFDGALRLIPFIANSENTYLLIFGYGTLKVYDPRANEVVWETATPYLISRQIKELQYAHTKYRMYFVQGDTPVHRFVCSADFTNWQFAPFNFSIAPNDEMGTTPNVALTPSGTEVGKTITLTASAFPNWLNTESYIVGERVIHTAKTWRALTDHKGSEPTDSNSNWEQVTDEDASVFTANDVGALVTINGGQVKITEYVNATQVKAEVLIKLNADIQAIAKSWSLKTNAFSESLGYSRSVCIFKQRLVLANTKNSPNHIWFSRIGDDSSFLESADDADAFGIASSSAQSDNILHLAQRGGVVALTGGAEFLIGSQGALTPASAQIDEHTSYGVQRNVGTCRVGSELLFVQRGGERLRAMAYRYEVDGLVSPELSAVATHITENNNGIREMTYQQTPNSVVWLVLGSGLVASITLNRDQEMNAWALHDFGCEVISICALPTALGEDQCFMLTHRGGETLLEELKEDAQSDCEIEFWLVKGKGELPENLDTAIFSSPLVNYENADGHYYAVPEINTLEVSISDRFLSQFVSIGNPFTFEIDLLPPDFSQVPATTMFHKIQVHEVAIFLNRSIGGQVNGQELSTKLYDQNAFLNLPYTGYAVETLQGWQELHSLKMQITHNKPLPMHVQSISMRVSVNDK